jgi:hypothetical protein
MRTGLPFTVQALPHDPHVEIEGAGGMRDGSDNFGLDRDSMVVDVAVEAFAQSDDVLV